MVKLNPRHWSEYVGIPFKHRGRGPDTYDCFGLVMEIYKNMGITIPDVTYGPEHEAQSEILNEAIECKGVAAGWRRTEVKPGAVLAFKDNRGAASHVAVAIDDDRFIHASEDYGQVLISRLSANYGSFAKRLIGAYEYAV